MSTNFYKGAAGNLSLHTITISLAILAAGASKTIEEMLPIGTQITGIRHITGNLGAGTAIKIESVDEAGTATKLLEVTTTSEKEGIKPLKPLYIGDTGRADIVLTNTGASELSGDVQIDLEYRFKGY